MDIKPIETVYNGYRFRSRLEARWAVFFDASRIEYEYEPEGFMLNDGNIKYLPDFYLPKLGAFVEIKPLNISEEALEDAETKCTWLYVETGKVVLLCKGDPVDMDMTAFFGIYEAEVGAYSPTFDYAQFVESPVWWEPAIDDSGEPYISEVMTDKHTVRIVVGCEDYNYVPLNHYDPPYLIDRCVLRGQRSFLESDRKAARQARFEHGETPRFRR